MSRHREPPYDFVCPWRDRCPELEQHSTSWIFAEYQRGIQREHEHWRVRDEMGAELHDLEVLVRQQAAEIDRLTAENKHLHQTAWCPGCRRQVFATLEGELPFAPIGPNAKAAALYLRHETKLPYRKLQKLMSDLFGLDFVAASSLGFEKRARRHARPIYDDLIEKMRHSDLVHADETYWREDGENVFIWYAGNEEVAVYRIDSHRSAEAAKQRSSFLADKSTDCWSPMHTLPTTRSRWKRVRVVSRIC